MIIIILIAACFAVVTGLAASARGRDPVLWGLIGLVGGVFGLLAVLVMEPVRED